MSETRSAIRLLCVVLTLGLLAGACSAGSAANTTTSAATEAAPTTEAPQTTAEPATTMSHHTTVASSASSGDFCEDWVGTEALVSAGPQGDPAAWATEAIQGLEAARTAAPDEAGEAVTFIADTLIPVIEAGEEEGFFAATQTEEFTTASGTLDDYLAANCGWDVIGVLAKEYEFDADFSPVSEGIVGFEFHNEGEELHEMVLLRFNDDTEETIDELLSLPQEEAMEKVTLVGVSFAGPGETDTMFADVSKGRYAVICAIPVGSTPDQESALPEEAPPHFAHGMKAEFTVE